jgi:hypothetical protein
LSSAVEFGGIVSKVKTPQEKKRPSYEHDRRNTYGENQKSSRKNIPRSKQLSHQDERRTVRQALIPAQGGVADEVADEAQSQALRKGRMKKLKAFRKSPDHPLGEVIERRLRRRTGEAEAPRWRLPAPAPAAPSQPSTLIVWMNVEIGEVPAFQRRVADDLPVDFSNPDCLLRKYDVALPRLHLGGRMRFREVAHESARENVDLGSRGVSANRSSRRDQDRHLMIANTIFRIIVRVSRWSSTGNAAAWPDRHPASHVTLQVSPKHSVSAPLSNPITRSGVLNHNVLTHTRLLLARCATIKSP